MNIDAMLFPDSRIQVNQGLALRSHRRCRQEPMIDIIGTGSNTEGNIYGRYVLYKLGRRIFCHVFFVLTGQICCDNLACKNLSG